MKSVNIFITILVLSLLSAGCEPSEPMPPDPPVMEEVQDTVFDLIWATRMDYEKEIVGSTNTQYYNGHGIVGGDIGDPPTLMAFNLRTGVKEWELVFDQLSGSEIDLMFRYEEILLLRNSHNVFAVNLESKSISWSVDLKSMGMTLGRMTLASNNKLYLVAHYGWHSGSDIQHLFEFDIDNGEYIIVYTESQDSIGMKYISPPVYYKNIEIDKELLLFNHWPNALQAPGNTIQNLYAIDKETGNPIWKASVTESFASNALHPPVIYDDRIVITGGDWSIYAFDIETGERLWRTEYDYPWSIWNKTNHLLYEDRLYVNNGQYDVSCLDPETGEILWNNPEGGPNCTDNMVYYEKEDLLVFTSWGYGSVMVLDALTGETIHREHRYDNSSYNYDVVYDPELDMFFTCTYKHAIGFKVRRPE